MGIGSSNQLSLFRMKHIYISKIDDDKIEFLKGDEMTITTTFYFDDDIKSKCFEILSKLKDVDNELDYVDIYHKDNKIYVIDERNDKHHLSNKITKNNYGYTMKI